MERELHLAARDSARCSFAIVCTAKGFGSEELSQKSAEMLALADGTRRAS